MTRHNLWLTAALAALTWSCAATAPVPCTDCNGVCVDIKVDAKNCGACGNACGGGQICVAGACQASCGAPLQQCSGACVDTRSDPSNCGACGTTCAAGSSCIGGSCQAGCAAPRQVCSGACVDTRSDPANCGACGTTCGAGASCVAGTCRPACPLTSCGTTCADTQVDVRHCGQCGRACAPGELCQAGACVANCPSGQTACGGADGGARCVTTASDDAHCGGCGQACATGTRCVGSQCRTVCGASQLACDGGACVNAQTDNGNCGACGRTCAAAEVCSNGACGTTCGAGLTTCTGDGGVRSCANTATDNANCGACGVACGLGLVCQSGNCRPACAPGTTLCTPDAGAAFCASTDSDGRNCGGCFTTCGAGERCAAGRCETTCGAGQTLCTPDGGAPYCARLASDGVNCGACGTACATGQACVSGACTTGCMAGQILCGADAGPGFCANVASDSNNCGACGRRCVNGAVCSQGACALTCAASLATCTDSAGAAYCANLAGDPNDCGQCGRACPGGSVCLAGACTALPAPALWLAADQLRAPDAGVPADGGAVSSWRDLTSSVTVTSVGSASTEPTYVAGALNGLPVVQFDGVDDVLKGSPLALFDAPDGDLTIFSVVRVSDASTQRFVFAQDQQTTLCLTNAVAPNFELGVRTGAADRANWGVHQGCSRAFVTQTDLTVGQWQLLTTVVRGDATGPNAIQVFTNGLQQPMEADGTGWIAPGNYPTTPRPFFIGMRPDDMGVPASAPFQGQLAELIVFRGRVPLAQRTAIEAQLATKWGLARGDVATGQVELLGGSQSVRLALTQTLPDGGTDVAVTTVAGPGSFSFPKAVVGPATISVDQQPSGKSCFVASGAQRLASGGPPAWVRCSFQARSLRPVSAGTVTTTSTTFEDVPGFQPLSFTTASSQLATLLTLFVPYAGGPTTIGTFGAAELAIEVDGQIVGVASQGSAFWGAGAAAGLFAVAPVGPGTHVARAKWRKGPDRVATTVGAQIYDETAAGALVPGVGWQGVFSATVLDSYQAFRRAGASLATGAATTVAPSSAQVSTGVPALSMTTQPGELLLWGHLLPKLWSPTDETSTTVTHATLRVDGAPAANLSFHHEGSSKYVAQVALTRPDAGVHTATSLWGVDPGGTASLPGWERGLVGLVFDGAMPAVSAARTGAVSGPGPGAAAQPIPGLGPLTLTLTKDADVVVLLTTDGVYVPDNGSQANVHLLIDGTRTLTGRVQTQNTAMPHPVNLFWVERLTAGAHTVSAQWETLNGGAAVGLYGGVSNLVVLGLE